MVLSLSTIAVCVFIHWTSTRLAKMRVLGVLLVCVTAVVVAKGPEFGDVVASSEMVATFQHNEPNIVVSPPGHRRHYQLVAPQVTFGDTVVDLVSDDSEGFFSSYERQEAVTIIFLQAKHEGANSSLGCFMPGQTFATGIEDKTSPLYAFEPMMTCNLQVVSHMAGPVELVFDIASQQNDRVIVDSVNNTGGVLLHREDALHLLRCVFRPVGNATLVLDRYPSRARAIVRWENASIVNLQFHAFVVSTKAREIAYEEWILALFLVVAFVIACIAVLVGDLIKSKILRTDAIHKNHNRAIAASSMTSITMTTTAEQLAAAQHTINERERH